MRILEYEYYIIKSAINKESLGKKGYKFPRVISIVLYSGRKKWNVEDYIEKVQEKIDGYNMQEFAKYNLVDVNNFSIEELINELKENDEEMLAVLEMIEEENKRLLKRGERQGKKQIAKNMLKLGLDIEIICKATELSKEQVEKMKAKQM